jgi:hypothetical protein
MLVTAKAEASLGGDAGSVWVDQAELGGRIVAAARDGYTMLEIRTDSGMAVREFAGRTGLIFALVWSGPAAPDLRQLLGPHFATYACALAKLQRPGLQRSLRIHAEGLLLESGGHLRAYFGRAALPDRFPPGFSLARLR